MKRKEHSLLYHTMHSRPMPGCLPLFFLLALGITVAIIWFVPVKMPQRVRPMGVGSVYKKEGRLADFLIRRNSPLPLHLPLHADAEYQEDVAASAMPLLRPVKVQTPPREVIFNDEWESAVLDVASLLALPGEETPKNPQEGEAAPAAVPAAAPAAAPSPAAEPVFHPGVEQEGEADREEVQP